MSADFYIYVYFRANGAPCYVGKGRGKRWRVHQYRSTNPHLKAIRLKDDGRLPVVIIRSGMTEAQAFETEIALIAAIGRETNGGPLVNLTDGGEGASGNHKMKSAEHTKKLGDASRGRRHPPRSPEFLAMLSRTHKGHKQSPQQIAARVASRRRTLELRKAVHG